MQGAGQVGLALIKHLHGAGAEVFVYDVNEASLRAAVIAGARTIPANEVYTLPVDVYAPCAFGATLNPTTIPQLRCAVVCGAANNQLLDEDRDGQALHDCGILYAPDFVVNAGGIINIAVEKESDYDSERARSLTENIYQTVTDVFSTCASTGLLPQQAAIRLAEHRLQGAASLKHQL